MMTRDFFAFALVYASRSLRRSRKRSILLIATVVLSVSVSIIAKAYADEIFRFWIASATESGTAEAQVHRRGLWDDANSLSRKLCFSEGDELEAFLQSDPDVKGFGQRLDVEGLISAGNRSIYFSGMGLRPESEAIISPRLSSFSGNQGAFVKSQDMQGIAIGKGLADALEVQLGDSVTLTVQTVDNKLNAVDATIVGIVNFPDTKVSKRLLYLNLPFAQDLLQLRGYYSELALTLRNGQDLASWSAKRKVDIQKFDAELRPWWEIFPPIRRVQAIWKSVVGVICLLLFLSTSLSVLNVIFLTVNERTIEIGVLMALGAKAGQIRQIFAIESAIVGLVGGMIGVAVACLSIFVMRIVGVPILNPFFDGYIFVYPEIQPLVSFLMACAAVIVAYLSSLIPSSKAARVEPVVAFRGQV